ncbi:tetratricopeptide repeat protein [Flavobacterium petrolei]|uniref:histidine kinase n=1 Tax=Flavobacterium petrolei TaxID=2259594 RepID=A0A482TN86_9FLAO|nr:MULTISPECIES: tetratricopeptide repeat protein [Flavobacterium]MDD2674511.1 tetratricopeptide repeat protein [Flavobacterium sp.]QIH38788.1 tetratricopeptide repeat protein [Flavobacterium sp. Sr18]RYJ53073.1 tetratricopeptide repeat protein [Flavobacterium petrolei]
MKFISSILLVVVLFFFGCNQKKKVSFINEGSEDTLSSYFSLANDFDLSPQLREIYIKKASKIVAGQENDSLHRVNLFKIANRYYNLDKFEEYKKTVFVVLKKSEEKQDFISLAKGYTYLADYYDSQAVSDSSFLYYDKAEKMYLELEDKTNQARIILNKANLQYKESDFLASEIMVFKALAAIKSIKANNIQYDAYNLLGAIYNELDDFDNAMTYHKKALSSIDDELTASFYQPKATSYNNIGYAYLKNDNYEQAKKYFQKGLEQENVFKDKPSLYAMLVDNLAYSEFKLNEMEGLPDLFYKSLKIRDDLQLTTGIIASKLNLSEYFISVKNIPKAGQYAKEALALSQETNNYRNILISLKHLSIIEPQNAAIYSKEYISVNEKLQKSERKIGNKFSRIEFETEEVKEKNSNLTTKNRNLLYALLSFTVFGLFLYIVKTQKNKNKVLVYKQRQQKANEDIYNLMISQQSTIETGRVKEKKRVAQELHDGVLGRMFGLRINLDSLNKFDDTIAVEKRNNYLLELKNIEQDIREISHDLSREKSELINNFVAILNDLFEDQKKTFESKLILSIDPAIKWDLMSNSTKINLYRIIQECLQNINKYANADTITIKFKKAENNLVLEIIDDGIGFNVNRSKKGIGLQNIRSRAHECNGTVEINSKMGEGTVIAVKIALE